MRRRRSFALLVGLATLAAALLALIVERGGQRRAARAARDEMLCAAVDVLVPRAAALLALPRESADLELRDLTAALGMRATLIEVDGRVHADSWTPPGLVGRLGNQLARPEVVAARNGKVGIIHGRSEALRGAVTYVVRLVGPVEHPVGFLRLASPEPRDPWPWRGMLGALLASLLAGWLADRVTARHHSSVARHLEAWSELPATTELETMAAEADRRFRATSEELSREVDATRTALGQVSEGVALLDREGVVRFANPAAAALLGPALTPGRPLIEAVRVPEVVAAVHETLASGVTHHAAASGVGDAELAVRVCPLAHPVLAAVVLLRDTRGERQLERARRALVADLAHELRTPLTVLSGVAEELGQAGTPGSPSDLGATLVRQVRKLRTFAEELEELARIESGQLRLHRESVDLGAVGGHVLEELQEAAGRAGVTLAIEGGPVHLDTDPVRLIQVLTNLVDNGIRYNRPGGHVTVRNTALGAEVRIDVEDDGIGIPANEVSLVFQRFYRVRRQAGGEAGSGLGLAIVKHLVQALGGTIQLVSREGRGTTATLLFPAGQTAV